MINKHCNNKSTRRLILKTSLPRLPQLNPNVSKITGVLCGYRVEAIEDKLMQKIRYMDKLVDELAKERQWKKF
jgi:hypothetical protein